QAAQGPDDFVPRVIAAKLESAALQRAAEASASALPSLFVALLDWATETAAGVRDELRGMVETFWRQLQEHDPGCTWQRVCEHPPYRHRIPFDDARLSIIGGWLRQAVGPELCDHGDRAGSPAEERAHAEPQP